MLNQTLKKVITNNYALLFLDIYRGLFMKRLLSLLLVLVLVLLSGCGAKENGSSMFEQSNETENVVNTSLNQSLTDYVGTWSNNGISFEKGGFILDISIEGKEMSFNFSCISSGPDSYTANLSENINLSNINNDIVTIAYEDDGWGNSGTVEITFSGNYILVDFKKVVWDSMANWGFNETTYKLEKNDQAHALITQGSNDYYKDSPITVTPTYDTSKASGILASLGMTEQEFRDSCVALDPQISDKYIGNLHILEETTLNYVESRDLLRNPNQYIGQHFILSENPYHWIICPQCNGTGYYSYAPGSSEYHCSDDVVSILISRKYKDGVHYQQEKNTEELVPITIDGGSRFTNAYGERVFKYESGDVSFLMYDMRDDVYNPNITNDSEVVPYLIFIGASGGNILQFQIISCDVTYEE